MKINREQQKNEGNEQNETIALTRKAKLDFSTKSSNRN